MNESSHPREPGQGDAGEHGTSRYWQRLFNIRAYFLTGLVVAAPITITIFLTYTFITVVDDWVERILPPRYDPSTYLPFSVPGLGVIIVFVALVLLGAFTANVFGRTLLRLGESIFHSTPIVRTVYMTLKQIFETVASQSASSFKQVALIEYPRKGIWAIAFVTSETRGQISQRLTELGEHDPVALFLPTTPNPTSGFLLYVPRKDVILLDMTVEQGAKLVISAGLVDTLPEADTPLAWGNGRQNGKFNGNIRPANGQPQNESHSGGSVHGGSGHQGAVPNGQGKNGKPVESTRPDGPPTPGAPNHSAPPKPDTVFPLRRPEKEGQK